MATYALWRQRWQYDYVAVSVSSRRMGEILRKFIYTFFRELTYRSDPSTDFHAYGSNDEDSRKGMPFGGFVDITPHFGGEIQ